MDFIRGQNTPYFSWFKNMIPGPLSYRDFRETGPRSENGCEKWHFLVWYMVRTWRTGRHTSSKNSHTHTRFPTRSFRNCVIITVQPENNVLRLERQQKRFLKTQFEFAYFYFSVLFFSFIWNWNDKSGLSLRFQVGGESNSYGFLSFYLFFYFPLKVAGGNPQPSLLNDGPG